MGRVTRDRVQLWEAQLGELRRAWHTLRGDLLTVAGVQRRELQHSAVVGWLLDPRAGHGLGTAFLEHFLALAEISLDAESLESATVALEAGRVLRKGRRVYSDILLRCGSTLVVVETKVDDKDRQDQCTNEVAAFAREKSADQIFFVFLTPEGVQPRHHAAQTEQERFRPVSFRDLSVYLTELVSNAGLTGQSVGERSALSYRDTLAAEFGSMAGELDPTTQFYLNNQKLLDTWESARKRVPDTRSKLTPDERRFLARNDGLLLQWSKLKSRQNAPAHEFYTSLGAVLQSELKRLPGGPVLWPETPSQGDYQYWVMHKPSWRLSTHPRVGIGLEWQKSTAKFSDARIGLVSFRNSENRAQVLERLTPILREQLPAYSGIQYWPILLRGNQVRGHWAERDQFAQTLVEAICDLWEQAYLIVDEVLAEIDRA